VTKKKRVPRGPYRKYSQEFRRTAVQRVMQCDNIVALADELGMPVRLLYYWRERQVSKVAAEPQLAGKREMRLRKEVSQLKRLLADKTLEADFFRGALQKVEARRQRSGSSGGTASTTESGK
jgi:transposase-like protein